MVALENEKHWSLWKKSKDSETTERNKRMELEIIPAIDIRGGKCVRLFQGDYDKETVYSKTPAEQAREWERQGAAIIHVVDLDGAKAGRIVNLETIEEITDAVSIPCELGGGIRTLRDAETALSAGIARVIFGTAACAAPKLAAEAVEMFGSEKIVVGIDARNGKVAVDGWTREGGADALELAARLADLGVIRFIHTDIDTDGALSGPNIAAQTAFCERVPNSAVIASGGISSPRDIEDLVGTNLENLEGVIVGKALYDGKTTLERLANAASPR
jgi:phosphoribosylformimino-5-aminoimidazole carboxamide ribotide isomerase